MLHPASEEKKGGIIKRKISGRKKKSPGVPNKMELGGGSGKKKLHQKRKESRKKDAGNRGGGQKSGAEVVGEPWKQQQPKKEKEQGKESGWALSW